MRSPRAAGKAFRGRDTSAVDREGKGLPISVNPFIRQILLEKCYECVPGVVLVSGGLKTSRAGPADRRLTEL